MSLNGDEEEMVSLSLAKLAIERPGWRDYLESIATKLGVVAQFQRSRRVLEIPVHQREIATGDLVLTDDSYYAIVRDVSGDRVLLFLANGVHVEMNVSRISQIPINPAGGSVANFQEILKPLDRL